MDGGTDTGDHWKYETMRNILSVCGVGLGTFFLVGLAVFCALLPFDFYWFEKVAWGSVAGLIASFAALGIKVCVDYDRRKGLFDPRGDQEPGRPGWTTQRILVLVIPLLAFMFSTISLVHGICSCPC